MGEPMVHFAPHIQSFVSNTKSSDDFWLMVLFSILFLNSSWWRFLFSGYSLWNTWHYYSPWCGFVRFSKTLSKRTSYSMMLTDGHFLLEKAQCKLYNNHIAIKRSLTAVGLPPHFGMDFSQFLSRLEGITTPLDQCWYDNHWARHRNITILKDDKQHHRKKKWK